MDSLATVEVIVLGLLPIIGFIKRWSSFRSDTYYRAYFITLAIFLAIPLGLVIKGDKVFLENILGIHFYNIPNLLNFLIVMEIPILLGCLIALRINFPSLELSNKLSFFVIIGIVAVDWLLINLRLLSPTITYCILLLPLFFLLGNLHTFLGPILAGFSLSSVIHNLFIHGFTLDSIIGWSNVFDFLDISSVGVKIVLIIASTSLGAIEFTRLFSDE
jgi:hypothetical protein